MRNDGSHLKDESIGANCVTEQDDNATPAKSLVVPCSKPHQRLSLPDTPDLPVVPTRLSQEGHWETVTPHLQLVPEMRQRFELLTAEAMNMGFTLVPAEDQEKERSQRETEKLETANRMAGGVAHDMANFLFGIDANTTQALQDPTLSKETRDNLLEVQIAANALIGLTRRLQRFAGAQLDKATYKTVNLKSIINDTVAATNALQKKFIDRHQLFSLDLNVSCAKDVCVYANASELTSVLVNLIKNGLEAMPAYGSDCIPGPHTGEIDVDVLRRGDTVHLTITDNGIGMDEDTRSNLFLPFFSTKGRTRTRGFGMSQVRAIVEEHSGQIRVKDTCPGYGTTIEIILPTLGSDTPPRFDTKVEKIGPKKVLLVEDNDLVREVTAKIVHSLGCEVVTVDSPLLALEILEQEEFSIIITDLNMPDMNGIEFARAHKASNSNAEVILMTGQPLHFSETNMNERGISDVLYKPFTADDMKFCIARIMPEDE